MTNRPTLTSGMTPFPYSVTPEAPVGDAHRLMAEHRVRHLPVVSNHEIVGMITPRDIETASLRVGMADGLSVSDCCSRDVYVVDMEEPIETVLRTLAERRISSAIVTRRGRLAGVFTTVDVCRCFGEYLALMHPAGDDAA